MIWFNLKKLEIRLLKGIVSDKHAFTYLLAQLGIICVLLQLPFEEDQYWWIWLLFSLAVTLVGLNWTFRLNQKGGNRDYFKRFVSISFVAVMRCLLLVFFISSLEGLFAIFKGSMEFTSFWTAFQGKVLNVLRGFILIFYFIYMIPSFKRMNAAEAQGNRVVGETR